MTKTPDLSYLLSNNARRIGERLKFFWGNVDPGYGGGELSGFTSPRIEGRKESRGCHWRLVRQWLVRKSPPLAVKPPVAPVRSSILISRSSAALSAAAPEP